VSFTLAPHAPYTVADATLSRIAMLAEELDLRCTRTCTKPTPRSQSRSSSTAHGRWRGWTGWDWSRAPAGGSRGAPSARRNCAAGAARGERRALPGVNLKLASGVAPVAALLRQGVGVAFGPTVRPAITAWTCSRKCDWRHCWPRAPRSTHPLCRPGRPLECATIASAGALGLQDRIGSIEVGKEADLIASTVGTGDPAVL